jgi:DNA-binding NarL/FixJ family response regulator
MHKTEELILRALSAGADGYLVKENALDDLMTAIDTIRQRKEIYLQHDFRPHCGDYSPAVRRAPSQCPGAGPNPPGKKVLRFIAEGKISWEIAVLMAITPLNVDQHRRNIMKRLNLKKNVELVKYAIHFGSITVPLL